MALITVTSQETAQQFDLEALFITSVESYNGGSAIFFDNFLGNPQRYNVTEVPSDIATASGNLLFQVVNVPATPLNISASVPFNSAVGSFILGEQLQIGQAISCTLETNDGSNLGVTDFQGGVVASGLVIKGLQSGATASVNGSGTTYSYLNTSNIYINSAKIQSVKDYNIASLNIIQYKELYTNPSTQIYTSTTVAAIEAAAAAYSPVFIGGTQTITGDKTFSGTVTLSGLLIENSLQAISGAGAINTTTFRTNITTTGANAYTLANGTVGQIKAIVLVVDGGDATITPTTLLGGTTLTLDAVGDSVLLQYGTGGWAVIGGNGYVLA